MQKYRADIAHCQHVLHNARMIAEFALPTLKNADRWDKHPLWQRLGLAALLHDIGHYVADQGHHKHSYYLILNAEELQPLGQPLREDIALLSWCHRKHFKNGWLKERFTGNPELIQLAAILRVADGLDRSHTGRVDVVNGFVQKEAFVLETRGLRASEREVIMDRKADAWKAAFRQSFEVRILPMT